MTARVMAKTSLWLGDLALAIIRRFIGLWIAKDSI